MLPRLHLPPINLVFSQGSQTIPHLGVGFALNMLSALIQTKRGYPAVLLVEQLVHQRFVRSGPLVLGAAPLKNRTPIVDRDRTVLHMTSRNSLRHGLYLHPTNICEVVAGADV